MTVLGFLRHQFKYDSWANREQHRVLSSLSAPPEQATKLLAHIIGAQWVWFDRLQQRPQRSTVWPDMTLADCAAQLRQLEAEWQRYLDSLSEDALWKHVSYKNSKGEAWSSTTLEILNQLLVHAAHHRGQISSEIRRTGATPAPIDYIHAARKGLLA
jgi:uncharacterized damage-inducible protein DinB